MRRLFALVLILTVALAACSGGSDGNNSNNNDPEDAGDTVEEVLEDTEDDTGEDVGDTDQPDIDDTGDSQDDADACTPRTECTTDECGTVDDGCGGTLECDTACNCIDGAPQGIACGECGLGQYQCATGETGEGTCVSPDLPGLDNDSTQTECAEALVFVDPLASSGGEGTRQLPETSYGRGLQSAEAGQTIILSSEIEYPVRLDVEDGVSVFGGFSPDTWLFDPDNPAVFNVEANLFEDTVGMLAENITQQTVVAHIDVRTEDESQGDSAYGLVAVDADPLELRSVTLEPGAGGDGSSGRDGDSGNDGFDGVDGTSTLAPVAAPGMENPSCPSANGGGVGNGAKNPNGVSGPATPGEDAPGGAAGGTAGVDGTVSGKAGGDGEDGAPVIGEGDDGQGGDFGGSILDDRWTASGDGEDGQTGPHGNGGGGGGGSWNGPQYCTEADGDIKYYAGIKGAAGASGGCGGGGGTGGGAGGASIGMLAIRSDVSLASTTIASADGGNGGLGGAGAPGGIGGIGGSGAAESGVDGRSCDPPESNDRIMLAWSSGDSGDGSDGGPGGDAGGGAGGPSWGIYCVDSAPSSDANTSISFGSPGSGGTSPVDPGEDGVAAETEGCP